MVRHAPTCLRGPASAGNPAWAKGRPDPIRRDLVDRVRSEIAAGTYDTPERFEAAIAKLFLNLDLD